LASKGCEDAGRVGEWIVKQGLIPDFIMASSSRRTIDTLRLVGAAFGHSPLVMIRRRLYMCHETDYPPLLQEAPADSDRLLVVGHNEGLQEYLSRLTGTGRAVPTCTLAVVELPIHEWPEMTIATRGKLLQLVTPDDLE
jgi:phosphohistidine phosphatase